MKSRVGDLSAEAKSLGPCIEWVLGSERVGFPTQGPFAPQSQRLWVAW